MNVEKIPLNQIKPYWRNPRVNDAAVAAVRASIERYGFNVPLVVDREMVIIAGHTRYKALTQIGATEADCVVSDMPKHLAKEYRLADNKTSEFASWDLDKLLPELREMKDIEAMAVFFPEYDLADLLKDAGGNYQPPTQDDVDQARSNLESAFAERSALAAADMIPMTCPHCREEFNVSKTEVAKFFPDA
jgi:hypothetical protein